jgi:FMN phosphatase YigB (HAD superfamily)
MSSNLILVDCDGVLCDWEQSFDRWMKAHGFTIVNNGEAEYSISKRYNISIDTAIKNVRIFNESANIGFLPPLRDSVKYVKKLHQEHGYIFHVITSLSNDRYAQKMRQMNLENLFGSTVFDDVIFLDTGADKDDVLVKYKDTGCYWVEDKFQNCLSGLAVGLKPILMGHPHNTKYRNDGVVPVDSWRDIYDLVTK